jgi:hypothetical protein
MIICGFPGVGKSYIFQNKDSIELLNGLVIADSDSSTFSKDHFPQNYIDYILQREDEVDIQFVSTHLCIRRSLLEMNIDFVLVVPDQSLKQEYVDRYYARGSSQALIDLIDKKWHSYLHDEYKPKRTIYLGPGEFLLDRLPEIVLEKGNVPHQ